MKHLSKKANDNDNAFVGMQNVVVTLPFIKHDKFLNFVSISLIRVAKDMILLEVALNNKVSLRRAENTTYYCIITLLGTTTVETLKIYMHNVFVRRTTSK